MSYIISRLALKKLVNIEFVNPDCTVLRWCTASSDVNKHFSHKVQDKDLCIKDQDKDKDF